MNSLHRTIEEGEVVVLKAKYFKPEFQDVAQRAVVVMDGFGMHDFTAGSALYVRFLSDGEETRFEGNEIDPQETEEYQAKHGKFAKGQS